MQAGVDAPAQMQYNHFTVNKQEPTPCQISLTSLTKPTMNSAVW